MVRTPESLAQSFDQFVDFILPTKEIVKIPADIKLKIPSQSSLEQKEWHYLTYIPWEDKYLNYVPKDYQDFFNQVLPHLHSRTTDVHTARCMPFVKELIQTYPSADQRVVNIAFILHDIGWSKISDEEICKSLCYKGPMPTSSARGPKEKHEIIGKKMAYQSEKKRGGTTKKSLFRLTNTVTMIIFDSYGGKNFNSKRN